MAENTRTFIKVQPIKCIPYSCGVSVAPKLFYFMFIFTFQRDKLTWNFTSDPGLISLSSSTFGQFQQN